MRHARTIAMATTLLADGRTEDVVEMVEPLLDPVDAPAAQTGQLLLRGLMARVEVLRRDRPDRALTLLPETDDVSGLCTCVRAEVAVWRGWAHVRRAGTVDEVSRGLRQLKDGLALHRSVHDPLGQTWALLGRARAYGARNEIGLMSRLLDEAAPLIDHLQDTQAERWQHDLRARVLRAHGQYDRAAEHVEALRAIGTDWGSSRVQGRADAHTALLRLAREAPPAEILEAGDAALTHLRRLSSVPVRPYLWALRARVGARCRQTQPTAALTDVDAAETALPHDAPIVEDTLQLLRARVALRRGNAEHALSLLDAAFSRARPSTPDLSEAEVTLLYGRALAHLDRTAEAEPWLHQARRAAYESGHHVYRRRARESLHALTDSPDAFSTTAPTEDESPAAAVDGFVAESREMQSVADTIRRIHPSHSPVLITGESGAGKRLVARALHATGPRADGPLKTVSCAPTQTEEPLRAQLFGTDERPGAVQSAQGGILVLEDVDALPLPLQSSLLTFLETGTLPDGTDAPDTPIDIRIIATTTADLDALVSDGRFRATLRDRLRSIVLHVPPLRNRRPDIPLLARHFLNQLRPEDSTLASITQPALEALLRYNWPGNVRQLRNEIERALVHVQSEPAPTITLDMLLDTIVETARKTSSSESAHESPDAILDPDQTLSDVLSRTEKSVIERVLRACDGQVTASADVLGLTRQGLYKKMKRLDIDASAFQSSSEPAPAS